MGESPLLWFPPESASAARRSAAGQAATAEAIGNRIDMDLSVYEAKFYYPGVGTRKKRRRAVSVEERRRHRMRPRHHRPHLTSPHLI